MEISEYKNKLIEFKELLRIDEKIQQLECFENKSMNPNFWENVEEANKVNRKINELKKSIAKYEHANAVFEELEIGYELVAEDANMSKEFEELCSKNCSILDKLFDNLEHELLYSGNFCDGDAIISINPGAGGNEALDWVEMLFKMYSKFCESKCWKIKVLDSVRGEVIGLDKVTFQVQGYNAYGMLRSEIGVHRLVRISPTDEKGRRHTTFASVEVLPVLDNDIEIELKDSDLKIDVYRASGPGGQCVNTTDSAVRITHLPTGIVVTCQNEKSQLQNKEAAKKVLRGKLYELEKQNQQKEIDKLRGNKMDNSFGSQIRNYVLFPYQLVKDLRSNYETGNVDAVLGGDIDKFIDEYHRWRVKNQNNN